jgi:predicted glycosyltransferase
VADELVPDPGVQHEIKNKIRDKPYLLLSRGGGADAAQIQEKVINAWKKMRAQGEIENITLVIFSGLSSNGPDENQFDDDIVLMPFSESFTTWIHGASLSVSCAGYNTCTRLLQTGVPAILIPNPDMSDQLERAQLLTVYGSIEGITHLVNESMLVDKLREGLSGGFRDSQPGKLPDLGGARRTVEILEQVTGS